MGAALLAHGVGVWDNSTHMDAMGPGGRAGMGLVGYRLRASLRAQLGGYLAVVLLLGLLGGLALASLQTARRTSSSFTVLWDGTNPSQLDGIADVLNPLLGSTSGYNPSLAPAVRALPGVVSVVDQAGIDFLPLRADGTILNAPAFYPPSAGNGNGSVDGAFFTQDRALVSQGRMADPRRADEFMLSAVGAAALHLHVGDVLPIGIYTNDQTNLPDFGTDAVKPIRVIDERVTGIVAFSNGIIADDVDVPIIPETLFTPALTDQLLSCCVNYSGIAVKVRGGEADAAHVAKEIERLLPPGFPPVIDGQSAVLDKAQRALAPLAIALGAFGGIVALATLFIVGQVVSRHVRAGADDRAVLRAMGADPVTMTVDAAAGVSGALVAGALLAGLVCVALSPVAPLGPVGAVVPHRISPDWTVVGGGAAALFVLLAGAALLIAIRGAPHHVVGRSASSSGRPAALAQAAAGLGVPLPVVTGMHFAFEPGSGRNSVPVRSVIAGAVVAIVVMVSTVTFGTSLNSLVAHPPLYGWNWDTALVSGGDIPGQQAADLLARVHGVAHWSGIYTADIDLDGTPTAVLGERPGASVTPPILSGHGLAGSSQVVLGPVTLAALHKHLGDTITVSSGGLGAPATLRIVGTAALPVLGSNGGSHLEMGTGAVLPWRYIPAVGRNPFDNPLTGPNAILVRLRPGADRAAATRALERVATATSNTANFGDVVTPVLRPAEIVNYRSLGNVPLYLGVGLAAGSVAALALTLLASVRRRRHDLALLKTLGFTRRQFVATVAWQATIAMVLGAAVGVPAGIALGRWLWDLFARDIHAVPAPVVPALTVALIAVGGVIVANLVALVPGRMAADTSVAVLLGAE